MRPVGAPHAPIDFPALFSAAPRAYLVLLPDAPDFHITEVNAAYIAATMTSREAFIGRGLFEVFPTIRKTRRRPACGTSGPVMT